jgi:hypothetical protein
VSRTHEAAFSVDILVIAICVVIYGINDWVVMATFGRAKQAGRPGRRV